MRIEINSIKTLLNFETGLYKGINNKDSTMGPSFKYRPKENWETALTYIRFSSRNSGFFQVIEKEDQLQLAVKYFY